MAYSPSPEEWEAISRNEAGLYRLSADDLAAIEDSGIWPEHPGGDDYVVVREVRWIGEVALIRWYKRQMGRN